MEKMTITETIGQVTNNNLGSIYSKDDVIRLLENIKEGGTFNFIEKLDELKEKLETVVNNLNSSDVVDFDSFELSLNCREIEVENVDINHAEIWDTIKSEIEDFINELEN